MTVAELIAKLQALPQDLPVVRRRDEFSSLVPVEPAVRLVRLYRLPSGEWGDYCFPENFYLYPSLGYQPPEIIAVEIDSAGESNG